MLLKFVLSNAPWGLLRNAKMHQSGGHAIVGGRYRILSYLGGGGFGQTFLAEDVHLPGHPCCVVKQLKPRLTDTLSFETAQRLFETEAQVLYKLNGYPQVPRLLAHFEESQEFYLAQEFIDGQNLSQEIGFGHPVSEGDAIALVRELLEVLAVIHQHHIIHRDLKPSNLIRRRGDGQIVVIDFGAVKQLSTRVVQVQGHTTRTIAIGSPGYMPSEQMSGRPRFCSDLYALGMIAIQALTGVHPRDLPEDPITCEIIWRDRASVSVAFADILDRMVRYDFRQRYQTAPDVLRDLYQFLSYSRGDPPPEGKAASAQTVPSPDTYLQLHTLAPGSAASLISEGGADYRQLQALLEAQDWREADAETRRQMLKLCGRDTGVLRIEDMRAFPCRDLYTLDWLWMDCSNGVFGLSVQRDIWRSAGGRTDGTHEALAAVLKQRGRVRVNTPWYRFGHRVGWRDRDHWLPYAELSFSLDAPKGHLPAWHMGVKTQSEVNAGLISALFSRLDVCRPYIPRIDITQKF